MKPGLMDVLTRIANENPGAAFEEIRNLFLAEVKARDDDDHLREAVEFFINDHYPKQS